MQKQLKFYSYLIPKILSGVKTSTWRLFDDKNLQKGDLLTFINKKTKKEFARAKIISVKKTKFGKLTPKDKIGHEPFKNDREMYKFFQNAITN